MVGENGVNEVKCQMINLYRKSECGFEVSKFISAKFNNFRPLLYPPKKRGGIHMLVA